MLAIVAARRRRRPTRMTPQRCGYCELGGEERQEHRASKMKVTARIHQVNITILYRALRLGSGGTAAAVVVKLWCTKRDNNSTSFLNRLL